MNFAEFKKSLESPQPIYLLITEQEYLKRKVYECCRDQVEKGAEIFNWAVFDLAKDPVLELLNTARTLPWMASRRWVYVKNGDGATEALAEYIKNPSQRTVLVLEVKTRPPGWRSLPTVEASEVVNPVQWVLAWVRKQGYQIDPRAAEALVELAGEDYQQLEAELEKQILWELESRKITLDSVLQMTRQARDYDVFALINAISEKNSKRALKILGRLYDSGMSAPQIVSMLYWNFRRVLVAREMLDQGHPFHVILAELKIWSYRNREKEIRSYPYELLREILIRLRQTDRLCKTTSTDPRIHLERVVVDT